MKTRIRPEEQHPSLILWLWHQLRSNPLWGLAAFIGSGLLFTWGSWEEVGFYACLCPGLMILASTINLLDQTNTWMDDRPRPFGWIMFLISAGAMATSAAALGFLIVMWIMIS